MTHGSTPNPFPPLRADTTFWLLLFGLALLLPSQVLAYGNTGNQGSINFSQRAPFKRVIHTVEKNESLWEIARFFGVEFGNIAQLNRLENPDLIFPGDELVIEIQEDYSIRVTEVTVTPSPSIQDEAEPVGGSIQVIYPDKDNLLAPENPLVVYQQEEAVLAQEPRAQASHSRVFSDFLEFVHWLMGDSRLTRQTRATSSPQIDPPPSPVVFLSQEQTLAAPGGNGAGVFITEQRPTHYDPDPGSPPPKA